MLHSSESLAYLGHHVWYCCWLCIWSLDTGGFERLIITGMIDGEAPVGLESDSRCGDGLPCAWQCGWGEHREDPPVVPVLVIERLRKIRLYRLTLDFDGSVYWTQEEGLKGRRSDLTGRKRGPELLSLVLYHRSDGASLWRLSSSWKCSRFPWGQGVCARLYSDVASRIAVGEDRDSDGQCLFSDEIVTLLDERA